MWIFGYGSLLWNPGFPFVEKRKASIQGFARRFCQKSWDHRGTPEAPGRVVTLVPTKQVSCEGLCFQLPKEKRAEILTALDHREKAGYHRKELPFQSRQGAGIATVYLPVPGSEEYSKSESDSQIASIIASAVGPSGTNLDYLLRLRDTLSDLKVRDEHVESLAQRVLELRG